MPPSWVAGVKGGPWEVSTGVPSPAVAAPGLCTCGNAWASVETRKEGKYCGGRQDQRPTWETRATDRIDSDAAFWADLLSCGTLGLRMSLNPLEITNVSFKDMLKCKV